MQFIPLYVFQNFLRCSAPDRMHIVSLNSDGLYLIVLIASFIGIVVWAFGARRKKRFESDGKIPFSEGE